MAKVTYAADTLTGGVSGCLDDILHTALEDGNTAIVISSADGKTYFLVYDTSEAGVESSPNIIIPDSNVTGTGAWVLSGVAPGTDLSGLTASATEINTACDGILATAAEINTACDGILATAAEINAVCDGAVTGSKAADNELTAGTFYYSKIGNVVTIYWVGLTHASAVSCTTSDTFLPAAYRPSASYYNTFFSGSSIKTSLTIASTGKIYFYHYNLDGSTVLRTAVFSSGVSYIVP